MIRSLFVIGVICYGAWYSFRDPFYALLFYLWLAYFRPEQWLWVDFVSGLRLSWIVGVWIILSAALRGRSFRAGLQPVLMLLFLLHSLLSVAMSAAPDVAWASWVEFAKVVLIGYMIVVLVDTAARLRMTLLTIAFSLGFEGAKEGWVELVRRPGAINTNVWPMLGDNNGVAVGMLMLTAILLALAQTTVGRWERRVEGAMALGTLYRALSTYSRGGFLAAGVLGLQYLFRTRRKLLSLVAAVVVIATIAAVLPDAFWQRMDTISSATSAEGPADQSIAGRLHFWAIARQMAEANPLWGVGQNAFNAVYDTYDTSNGRFGHARSVHSSWFGILAELGYPGLLLFISLYGWALVTLASVRRRASVDRRQADLGVLASGIEAGLLVFAVGGAFVPFQYNEMLWHFLAMSMAVGALAAKRPSANASTFRTSVPTQSRPTRTVPFGVGR